ncbi:RT0821/Lpp0805 family surface protein (plasmid) [Rhizobium sp. TRM96647]|uniref:RT0821/Lpp0805 family surface protein n=1 Tax=unclassified Rhizobium TaxID=2613769 RepID=UPI0021E715A1|nr:MULTISPECIES: RT0821/Lpp0805 family surface protein [unclassified Rhizobium]MCV3735492.1 RT0821/Lpp0805 family surface protein [Rhizobium sp. TRM96647]MCV3757745.1 RT0821/Lpp0805 family surface protein [Rhizobium sp. TRM96650]
MTLWTMRSRLPILALCALPLAGCMAGGLDLASDMKVDKAVKTSAVPGQKSDNTSDAATVRNAVSSADLARNDGGPIPWANTVSGSAGVVTGLAELNDDAGRTCRDFTTTLHSYAGIANYDGRACVGGDGIWTLTRFDRQG